ncbi:hypothetical protein [Sabulicella glaciei]|uniref:Uncharacterized protein n=1 Tax=Sabulicella glaciei TaxID=2984948 RepID=A0ABT3NQW7_9PROT|nr:hypothetical protein [Roseococcus sp. MDT2-1-1]MCW8084278.1 hypothetical protein [Roseococcus sp. MDT2-1-1]
MEVRVHIERLILDGPSLGPADRERLEAALSTELSRMIAERGLPPGVARGFAIPGSIGGTVSRPSTDPEAYGRALAGAVYAGLGDGT